MSFFFQTVLLTGAANGIGRRLAQKLAKCRINLILWDVDVKNLERTRLLCQEEETQVGYLKYLNFQNKFDSICTLLKWPQKPYHFPFFFCLSFSKWAFPPDRNVSNRSYRTFSIRIIAGVESQGSMIVNSAIRPEFNFWFPNILWSRGNQERKDMSIRVNGLGSESEHHQWQGVRLKTPSKPHPFYFNVAFKRKERHL